MAVITFDDFLFQIIEPQLSVVNLDMFDMGEQAAKVVLRRIRTPQYLVQSQTTVADINRTTINEEAAIKPESIKQNIKIRKYSNLFDRMIVVQLLYRSYLINAFAYVKRLAPSSPLSFCQSFPHFFLQAAESGVLSNFVDTVRFLWQCIPTI